MSMVLAQPAPGEQQLMELEVSLWGLHTKTAKLVNKQRAGPTVFHALWRCLRADYADAQQHFDAIWASRGERGWRRGMTLSGRELVVFLTTMLPGVLPDDIEFFFAMLGLEYADPKATLSFNQLFLATEECRNVCHVVRLKRNKEVLESLLDSKHLLQYRFKCDEVLFAYERMQSDALEWSEVGQVLRELLPDVSGEGQRMALANLKEKCPDQHGPVEHALLKRLVFSDQWCVKEEPRREDASTPMAPSVSELEELQISLSEAHGAAHGLYRMERSAAAMFHKEAAAAARQQSMLLEAPHPGSPPRGATHRTAHPSSARTASTATVYVAGNDSRVATRALQGPMGRPGKASKPLREPKVVRGSPRQTREAPMAVGQQPDTHKLLQEVGMRWTELYT